MEPRAIWMLREMLFAHKANVNARGHMNMTPLDDALMHGGKEMVDLLRQHGDRK